MHCLGQPVECLDCCRKSHEQHPFHRVERWTGEYYTPAWLNQVGVIIHLGHNGHPCPEITSDIAGPNDMNIDNPDDWEDSDTEEETPLLTHISDPPRSVPSTKEVTMMCIVDRSGVHDIPVHWCRCPNHHSDERQLLAMGLFPSTYLVIKTAFTFQVLDDFRMDNLECKTSALNFYNKLRRITSNAFPDSVKVCHCGSLHLIRLTELCLCDQNRYEELMRVSRQWRNLKYRKWHGFGHNTDQSPRDGDMALECPTCPKAGINISNTWNTSAKP